MDFEWSEQKSNANVLKHQVTFEEATTVFNDALFVNFLDTFHSDAEERYIALGRSATGRVISVCYTMREGKTRLISARKVTAWERRVYQEG